MIHFSFFISTTEECGRQPKGSQRLRGREYKPRGRQETNREITIQKKRRQTIFYPIYTLSRPFIRKFAQTKAEQTERVYNPQKQTRQ